MPEWICIIRPSRAGFAESPTENEQRIMSEHFAYLKSLLDSGTLVMAGPALDAAFGTIVYEADDEEAARSIMAADPSVSQGVMNMTLHPFRTSLLRGRE
jgi:uncharacterized protein YciI